VKCLKNIVFSVVLPIKFKYLLWDIRTSLKKSGYDQIPQLSCSNSISLSDEFKL
jgi:hypothetical protein